MLNSQSLAVQAATLRSWAQMTGRKIDAVMQVADTVVAGNQYLARRARQAGAQRVEIVPTAIDLDRYRNIPASAAVRLFHPTTPPTIRPR